MDESTCRVREFEQRSPELHMTHAVILLQTAPSNFQVKFFAPGTVGKTAGFYVHFTCT